MGLASDPWTQHELVGVLDDLGGTRWSTGPDAGDRPSGGGDFAIRFEGPGRLDPARLRLAMAEVLDRYLGDRPSRHDGAGGASGACGPQVRLCQMALPDLYDATVVAALRLYLADHEACTRDLHMLLLTARDAGSVLAVAQPQGGMGAPLAVARDLAARYDDPGCALPQAVGPEAALYWRRALVGAGALAGAALDPASDQGPGQRLGQGRCLRIGRMLAVADGLVTLPVLGAVLAAQLARRTGQARSVFAISDPAGLGPLPLCVPVDEARSFAMLCCEVDDGFRVAQRFAGIGAPRIEALCGMWPDITLTLGGAAPMIRLGAAGAGRLQLLSARPTPIALHWSQAGQGALRLNLRCDGGRMDLAQAEVFAARAVALLRAALDAPGAPLETILGRGRVLPVEVPVPAPVAPPCRLHDLVAAVARAQGHRVALRTEGGREIRYDGLIRAVEARAARLADEGLRAGMRVAFLAERGADFVITLLALSRLGAVFSAFDMDYPPMRLIEQARGLAADRVLGHGPATAPILRQMAGAGLSVLHLGAGGKARSAPPPAPVPPPPRPCEIGYYLFTSGSTGTPRAIGVGHGALPQFIAWQARRFGIGPGERVSMLSGLSHDPVMRDLFLPLLSGGTLLIPGQAVLRAPRRLLDWLRAERPGTIHTTPAMGRALLAVAEGVPTLPGCRRIFWGGDLLPGDLVQAFAAANPGLRQVNFYGATETPQAVLYHEVGPDDRARRIIPVGKPPEGLGAEILGAGGQVLDGYEPGALRITMPYVTRLPEAGVGPDGPAPPQIHDTGDFGYRLADGSVQILGRHDDQVSIRGYRVSLGDVEQHLLGLPGVREACLRPQRDPSGQTQLIAHVVMADPDAVQDARGLRDALRALVPDYMVPTAILFQAALPLLPNGKRDLRALDAMQAGDRAGMWAPADGAGDLPAMTGAEQAIADIYSRLLGLPVLDAERSFQDLGADSLNSIQAMMRLETLIDDLPEDWVERDIRDLAGRMRGEPAGATGGGALMIWLKHMAGPIQADWFVLVRALAILSVVSLHYRFFSTGGGATIILLMLVGHSLVRFQLPRILREGSCRSLLVLIAKVAAITVPVTLLLAFGKYLQGERIHPSALLFYADFVDHDGADRVTGGVVWLWFIACYLQIMAGFALLLSRERVRALLRDHLGRVLVLSFLGSILLLVLLMASCAPQYLIAGAPLGSRWTFMPTTHLPTILLGGLTGLTALGALPRMGLAALAIPYAGFVAVTFSHNQPLLFLLVIALIAGMRTVRLPRGIYLMTSHVSQAALYLYLLHEPFASALTMAGIALSPFVQLVAVTLLSIGFGRVWDCHVNTAIARGFAKGAERMRGISGGGHVQQG